MRGGHRRRPRRAADPHRARARAPRGEGGDDTTAIDAAAENAVVDRLEALEADFTLVSEELGERAFGDRRTVARRRRPDRRLSERQARDSVLLALARGRGRPHDGRRRVRLRLRLRGRRGMDCRAGRRRVPERRTAGSGAARRTRSRSSRSRRRRPPRSRTRRRPCSAWRAAPSRDGLARALALPPRRRSRRRRLLAQACALDRHRSRRSCSCTSAASRSSCSRIHRSRRRRSTSSAVHASSPRERPNCAARSKQHLPHRLLGGYAHIRPKRRTSTSTTRDSLPGTRSSFANCWQRTSLNKLADFRRPPPLPHGGPSPTAHTRP